MNINYSDPLQAADKNITTLSHDTVRWTAFKQDFSLEDCIHLRKLKKGGVSCCYKPFLWTATRESQLSLRSVRVGLSKQLSAFPSCFHSVALRRTSCKYHRCQEAAQILKVISKVLPPSREPLLAQFLIGQI